MSYYFSKMNDPPIDQALEKVTEELKKEGFGVLAEIGVRATLRKKLDVDFRPYQILGACNPPFAHQALEAENKIGTMLPCNVIVQQRRGGVEVAAVDPVASRMAIKNPQLGKVTQGVRDKLKLVINRLKHKMESNKCLPGCGGECG